MIRETAYNATAVRGEKPALKDMRARDIAEDAFILVAVLCRVCYVTIDNWSWRQMAGSNLPKLTNLYESHPYESPIGFGFVQFNFHFFMVFSQIVLNGAVC